MKIINDIQVSIIVPNYNHGKYIKQRLDSIINQTFTDYELILLDDYSSDESRDILLSYKNNPHVSHIILNTQNSGSPFLQWEKGIKLARGKYIWIAESDDYTDIHFLEYTVKALTLHPQAHICYTGSFIIDTNGNKINDPWFDQWIEDDSINIFPSNKHLSTHMLESNTIYNASMVLFKKEGCLSSITQAYTQMKYAGDWLFWIEQIRKGNVIEIHKKLNYFRKHAENTTSKGDNNGNAIEEIAFIKNFLYHNVPLSYKKRLIDKARFYYNVSCLTVSQKRKNELLKTIAKRAKVYKIHYIIGSKTKGYKRKYGE